MLVIKNTLSLALMIQIGKKKYENADRKHLWETIMALKGQRREGEGWNISCQAREILLMMLSWKGLSTRSTDDPNVMFRAQQPFMACRTDAGRAVHALTSGGQRLSDTSHSMHLQQSAV